MTRLKTEFKERVVREFRQELAKLAQPDPQGQRAEPKRESAEDNNATAAQTQYKQEPAQARD